MFTITSIPTILTITILSYIAGLDAVTNSYTAVGTATLNQAVDASITSVNNVYEFVNVDTSNQWCPSTVDGFALFGQQVQNSSLIVSGINSNLNCRVSNVTQNKLYSSSIPNVISTIGNTADDRQFIVNSTQITLMVVASTASTVTIGSTQSVYATYWGVDTATLYLYNVYLATYSAFYVKNSVIVCASQPQCPNSTYLGFNDLNFFGSSVDSNSITCDRVGDFSYQSTSGKSNTASVLVSGVANVTSSQCVSDALTLTTLNNSNVYYTVQGCNSTSLVVTDGVYDSRSIWLTNWNTAGLGALDNSALYSTLGQTISIAQTVILTLTNVSVSQAYVNAYSLIGTFSNVSSNSITTSSLAQCTVNLVDNFGGAYSYVSTPCSNITVSLVNVITSYMVFGRSVSQATSPVTIVAKLSNSNYHSVTTAFTNKTSSSTINLLLTDTNVASTYVASTGYLTYAKLLLTNVSAVNVSLDSIMQYTGSAANSVSFTSIDIQNSYFNVTLTNVAVCNMVFGSNLTQANKQITVTSTLSNTDYHSVTVASANASVTSTPLNASPISMTLTDTNVASTYVASIGYLTNARLTLTNVSTTNVSLNGVIQYTGSVTGAVGNSGSGSLTSIDFQSSYFNVTLANVAVCNMVFGNNFTLANRPVSVTSTLSNTDYHSVTVATVNAITSTTPNASPISMTLTDTNVASTYVSSSSYLTNARLTLTNVSTTNVSLNGVIQYTGSVTGAVGNSGSLTSMDVQSSYFNVTLTNVAVCNMVIGNNATQANKPITVTSTLSNTDYHSVTVASAYIASTPAGQMSMSLTDTNVTSTYVSSVSYFTNARLTLTNVSTVNVSLNGVIQYTGSVTAAGNSGSGSLTSIDFQNGYFNVTLASVAVCNMVIGNNATQANKPVSVTSTLSNTDYHSVTVASAYIASTPPNTNPMSMSLTDTNVASTYVASIGYLTNARLTLTNVSTVNVSLDGIIQYSGSVSTNTNTASNSGSLTSIDFQNSYFNVTLASVAVCNMVLGSTATLASKPITVTSTLSNSGYHGITVASANTVTSTTPNASPISMILSDTNVTSMYVSAFGYLASAKLTLNNVGAVNVSLGSMVQYTGSSTGSSYLSYGGNVPYNFYAQLNGSQASYTNFRLTLFSLVTIDISKQLYSVIDIEHTAYLYLTSFGETNATLILNDMNTTSLQYTNAEVMNIVSTNVTSCELKLKNVTWTNVSLVSSNAHLTFSNVSVGEVFCTDMGANSLTIDVLSQNCPEINCESVGKFVYNVGPMFTCPLPKTADLVFKAANTSATNDSMQSFNTLTLTYSQVQESTLSVVQGNSSTLTIAGASTAVMQSTNVSVSQVSQLAATISFTTNVTFAVQNVQNATLAVDNVSVMQLSITNVTKSTLNVANVSSLVITLGSSGKQFVYTNITNAQFVIDDVNSSTPLQLRYSNSSQDAWNSSSNYYSGTYYYKLINRTMTWLQAVELCGSNLSSIRNDADTVLFASWAGSGTAWLGGLSFSYCLPITTINNRVRWLYYTSTDVANSVMLSLWPPVRTLCLAYNFNSSKIEEPAQATGGTAASCFRSLPAVCKISLNQSGNAALNTCPTGWTSRTVGPRKFCYQFNTSWTGTWADAISWCAQAGWLNQAVAMQSRLLDFDTSDPDEAPFVNGLITSNGTKPLTSNSSFENTQVWISALNYNPVCESSTADAQDPIAWLDRSAFIRYSSPTDAVSPASDGKSCAPVTLSASATGWSWVAKADAASPPSDCIDQTASFASCRFYGNNTSTLINRIVEGNMTLQQALITCGKLNGTIASYTSVPDWQNTTSNLNQSAAWLGVMTFPKCETSDASSFTQATFTWSESDPRLLSTFATDGTVPQSLCVWYSLTDGKFTAPTQTLPRVASCFQPQYFVCKQLIYSDSAVQCPVGWNARPLNLTSGYGVACYYFVNATSTWPAAVSFCASLASDPSPQPIETLWLNQSTTVPRLLFFFTSDYATEVTFLKQTYPGVTQVWTMAMKSGSVCENTVFRDYWIDGTPFSYLGNSKSMWVSRTTFCPLLQASATADYSLVNYDWSYSNKITAYGSSDCTSYQAPSVICKVPPMATTTTRDPRITTTPFPLPTPYILSDVRYQNTADHYWCFLGSCVLAASNQSYIAYATYDSPSGNIVSPTASAVAAGLIVVYDNGTKTSPELIALTDAKLKPQYSQFPILQDNMANVVVEADLIASSTASFKAVNRSCIIAATYSQANVADNQRCIFKPQLCYYGLSAAVWVKFPFSSLYGSTTPMVMIGTDTTGFSFYQKGTATGVTVTTNTDEYKYEVIDSQVAPDVWLNIGFRWSSSSGILIYVNNIEHFSSVVSQRRTLATSPTTASYLSIGCTITSATQRTGFATMSLAHVAIWMWNLRTPERVFLSGGLNYVLSMTTATTNAVVSTASNGMYTFDYGSNMAPYQPTWTSSNLNPMFSVANFYDELTSSSTLSAGSSSLVSVGPATNVPQIKVTTLTSAASFIKFSFTGRTSCMNPTGGATFCPKGIGVGMILNITSTAFNALMNSDPFVPNIIMLYHQKFAVYLQASLLVIEFYDQSAAIQFSTQWLDSFVSFGFTWSPVNNSLPLTVYVNGQQQPSVGGYRTINVTYYLATAGVYAAGDLVIGSSFGTVPNLQARDLVIWDRYLFPVDAGRFLGLTQDQFQMFLTNEVEDSNYWWTTDIYAYNTMQLLSAASGLYVLRGATYNTVPDRWNKSVGIVLPGSTTVYNYPWLLTAQGYPPVTSTIGLFPQSNCFLNPGYYTCVRGLSVAAWIMITDPESSSIQIFYSTGDSVALMYTTAANDPQNIGLDGSTGCTILQDGMYIGVSCSTSSQMYDMYMDQTLFQVGTWINLGFTFSIQNGLRLFINGRYTGLSQPTGISVPRPPAAKLSHGRCVIGHYSSDYTDFWTSEGSFTYANGNFSDLFILTEEKSTDEFGAMIGLDNNYYYSTATMYYPLNILVTGSLQLLQSVRQNLDATLPYGPYGTVGISTGVDLGGSTSGLLIGALSVTDCLHNVSVCAESGMSLSTWISISSSCQAVGGNQTVYILRTSVYPQNNEGVFIYAEFNKLYVTVQYNRTGYSVPVPINSLNLDRYFNLAFIWEKTTTSYLLTVYVNGSAVPSNMTTYIYVQSVPRSYEPLVFGALPSASSPSNFSVFNFAFWNTSLSSTQLNQLSGFTTSRLQYLSNSDIYWVFSSTYKSIQVIQPQLENNADLSMDRFGTDLVAELDSTQQSYVILGNKAQLAAMQSCVVMPSNCVGLFLQFWAYLYPAQNGYILSSGAENTSIQGIVISQYSVNVAVNRTNGSSTVNSLSYLGVLIRTNTKAYYYSFDISASINSWASYAVFWNRSETTPLALYVNNYLFTAVYSNFTDSSANLTSGLYLGRAATGPTNFISGLFDDILVKNIFPTSSFSLDAMINQVTCYTGAVAIYALKNGGSPRQSSGNITQASSHLNHTQQAVYLIGTDTIFVLDTAISCASNPAACSLGLTASVWANIRSLPQISTPGKIMSVIIASGVPSNMTGFAIYLLSALTQTTVTLRFELNDGKNYWLIDCPMDASALVGNWINYAISWSPSVGLFGFINGIGVMQQLQKVSPPPAGNVNQTSRDLMLGKFTSYDMTTYLDIVFDTTAFWATAFTVSGGTTPRTLSGDCTTATYAVTAIPSAPAVTTFQPNPNCAVQVVGVCTDQTIANVLSMGTKNFTAAIQVPAAQLLLPNLLTLTSNVIVTKTAGDGMTTTISPSGQAIPAPYSASFLTSSASILQNVASSVQTSALAGISKSDIGALARNFTGVADNILDPSTASVWASVGANASSSILKAMEQFLVVLGPSIVDPTTNTSTIVGNNIITNVAIVNSKNCSNGLQYPLASDPAVQRALNTWGSVDSISIPQNACMAISNSSVVVVSNIYNSISSVLPSAVVATGNGSTLTAPNSRVISITTSPPLSFNGSVVKMVMQLLQPNTYMNNSLACAYWNFTSTSTGGWSTNGCNLVQGNSTYVTCECNHMTNFVVLMQPVRAPLPDAWKLALLIIYIIGLSVSVICLVWFLFVLIKFKANLLKDDRCLITINLIGAFLTSDILLLISQVVQGSACKLLSILIQFFITAAFEWLYFEALHYHYAVSAGQLHGRFWKCYVPLGWLLPAVITAICVALFPSAYGAGWRCWLSYGSTALYVFIGTCAFFSLMAIVTNLVVLCNISHSKCNQDITAEFHRSAKLNTAGTTLIVAGWLFGSFAVGPAAIPFELLYTLIFSFNGLIVFVFFGVTSHQLLPLFLCRSAENRVVDSVAASLAGSIIDVRSINDKTVLVSDSRPGSSRRSRPGSSSSVRIVAGGDPRVAEEMGIVQVPRISYRPDSEIVERLKKKQQEIAAATNQLQDQAVPSDLFEVGNTQRKPTRKLLPLTTKQGTSKSLPFSMPKSSSGAADTASASTSSDVASPPSFIKPKKQKQRKNRNSNQTSKSPRPSSPSDD